MPEFNYAAAKQAGWSDDEINDYLEKKNAQGEDLYISRSAIQQTQAQAEAKPEPGFIQGAVQAITNLPARLATGAVKAGVAATGLATGAVQSLMGKKEEAAGTFKRSADIVEKMNTEGVDLGYFGIVKPFMAEADTAETFGGQAKGFVKDVLGSGLEASSYVIGGPAVKTGLGVAKGAVPLIKGIGSSAVRAVPSGAAGLAGAEMQKEDATIGSVVGAGLIGTIAGLGLGAASPIVGKVAGKTIQTILNPVKTVGGALESAGNKILTTVIRPAQKDVKDGFLIENVTKYGVGGNLQDSFDATAREISARVKLQRQMIQDNPAEIDIGNVFQLTEQALSKGKLENVGELGAIRRVLGQLRENLEEAIGKKIEPGATVSVPDAQLLKQGFGKKGAWEFGKASPDAKAEEAVYTKAYSILKEAIERDSPDALKEVNKQLSELIPIQNAIIRRMPVDARNNALSLTDSIALAAAMANPKALSLLGLQRLLKSGEFGKALAEKGAAMLKKEKAKIPKDIKVKVSQKPEAPLMLPAPRYIPAPPAGGYSGGATVSQGGGAAPITQMSQNEIRKSLEKAGSLSTSVVAGEPKQAVISAVPEPKAKKSIVVRKPSAKSSPAPKNTASESGIKEAIRNHPYYRREGSISDKLAGGTLMKGKTSGGEETWRIATNKEEKNALAAKGYKSMGGVDTYAQESGYDNPELFLSDLMEGKNSMTQSRRAIKKAAGRA